MALISGHDGAATMPTGHGGKAIRWNLDSEMTTKDVSGYGDGRARKHRGGLVGFSGTIGILLQNGTAGALNMTAPSIDGVTLTLTSMTGCAHSGTALFNRTSIQHDHTDPAIGGTYNFIFNGIVAETWT